jgi:NADH-quinone oxidoreductase subunit C
VGREVSEQDFPFCQLVKGWIPDCFEVAKNHRFRLKVPLEEGDTKLPSLVSLWPGANWLERETWDMYGITFEGHPNLRRIYLYEEFEGHPLRKDYPKEKRQPLVGPRN